MQALLTGHNIEITEALREKVQQKLKKRLGAFEKDITSIRIILNVDKNNHQVEGVIHVPHQSIHAKSESNDMYEALDDFMDKAVRQLKKHKEKIKDHHRD